jgi:SAM-dependent methyltransferase
VASVNANLTSPRKEVVRVFSELISKIDKSSVQKVLVIGGPPSEPELLELKSLHNLEVHFAGVEEIDDDNWHFLDANSSQFITAHKFDYILCSQVLEHLWNPVQVFLIISGLLKSEGHAWIACPANNFPHGSPHFYSSGYSLEFLESAAKYAGLTNIKSGVVANQRIHYYRQLLQLWPNSFQFKYPLLAYYPINGSFWKKITWQLKSLPYRLAIGLSSKDFSDKAEYGVEVWILTKKDS